MKTLKLKVILGLFAIGGILFWSIPVQASGESNYEQEITPRYTYIQNMVHSFDISSGKAICKGTIVAKSGQSCSVSLTLQKKVNGEWKKVKNWYSTGTTTCVVTGSYSVTGGTSYRLKLVYKAGTETCTKYSVVKTA